MRSRLLTIAIALCVALGVQQTASAQGANSTFGNTSANRSFNSNTSYTNNRSFGGTASTAGSGGLGDLGDQGLDLTPNSGNTGGTLFSTDQFKVGSRQVGQFVGTSLFDPQMFIGAATGGAQSGASSFGGRTQQGRTQQGRSLPGAARGNAGAPGLGGEGRRTATSIRATARLAFAAPQIDPGRISASLVRRLQQPGQMQTRWPVNVTVDGRTATLRGQVATEYDRIVAERFVRMEPGISQVANELVVAQRSTDMPVDPPADAD